MYTLDFETIRQVMQEHQKTGFLSAELPSGVPSLQEPCRIEINILAGAMASCAIISSSGSHITGKKAAEELSRLGRLRWTFMPNQEVVAPSASSVGDSLFPLRTVQLEQREMRSWQRMHRAVFALADGTKSVTKIAAILSTSPDLVDKALRDLQAIKVIVMRPQNGKRP
jgi:hypothetical protein